MATIADLVIGVHADTAQAEKGLSSFGSKVKGGFGKALLPAVAVLGGIAVVAKKAADTAVDLGESQNAANVVFGKGSKIISDFARVADKEAGLSMRQLNELVTPLGASLQNYGFSAKGAAKNSVMLAKRAADMASVFNKDVPEAMEAIQAGLRGEADPLEKFGVGLSAAAVEAKALSMGLGKTTVDMSLVKDAQVKAEIAQTKYTKAVKEHGKGSTAARSAMLGVNSAQRNLTKTMEGGKTELSKNALMTARLKLIMEQTSKLQGDFKNTSDGVANSARINAARQENLEAKIGKGLIPVLQLYQEALGKVMGFMSEHTGATKVAVGVIGGLAAAIVLVNVGMKAYAAGSAVVKAATVAWTGVQWLLNAALTANPIGIVVVAIAALVAGFIIAYKKSETFRAIVQGALKAVTTAANAVLGFFRNNWKTIAVLISGPFAPLVLLATDAFGIRSKLVGAAEAIVSFFRGNWKTIAVLISGPFAPLVALATNAFGIRDKLVGAFETVKTKVGAAIKALPGLIVGGLPAGAQAVYNAALALGGKIVNGVLDGVASLPGKLKDKIGGAIGGALSHVDVPGFSPPHHAAMEAIGIPLGKGAIDGFILGVAELPAKMGDKVRASIEAARSAIDAKRGVFSGAWSQLAGDALSAFDAVQGKVMTKSEKLLADLATAHEKADLAGNITTAQVELSNARDTADPEAVKAAEAKLADALYQLKVYNLQKSAAAERLQLDSRTALQRRHLEQELSELEANLAKRGTSQKVAHAKIMKLLDGFGVDYKTSGNALGKAFAKGLAESLGGVEKAVAAIMKAVSKYLPHSPADKGPLSELPGWGDYLTRGLPAAVNTVNGHLDGLARPSLGTTPQRGMAAVGAGGPALHVENLTVNDPIDLELLAARVAGKLGLR